MRTTLIPVMAGTNSYLPAWIAEILRYGQQQHDLISGAVKSWQHQTTVVEDPMVAIAVTDYSAVSYSSNCLVFWTWCSVSLVVIAPVFVVPTSFI